MGAPNGKNWMHFRTLGTQSVFTRENKRRLGQALSLLQDASIAVVLSLAGIFLTFTLLSITQNKTIPWLSLMDNLTTIVFIGGCLLLPCILLVLIQYASWRFNLVVCRELMRHLFRSGQQPPAACPIPISYQTWRQSTLIVRTTTRIQHLDQQLTNHPPARWSAGKAPIGLFNQANLHLAP